MMDVGSKGMPLKPAKTEVPISVQAAPILSPAKSAFDTRSVGDTSMQSGRVIDLQNYVVNKIELMKRNQASNRKLTQLAAFIPDYILKEESSRKIPYQSSYDAVVLMVDVSGFTALTEAYSLKGKGGTDQLTKTLMSYIGPLAECILQADGDIIKYAGDAFLACWKSNLEDYTDDIQRCVDCALYIQEKYGSYYCKEVDITIRVKIGIGCGMTHFCWIGNESYQHYICFGPGVEAASGAEKHCTSGEVILHPAVWKHCNPSNYKVTIKDETFRIAKEITIVNPEKRGRPIKNNRRQSIVDKHVAEELIRPHLAQMVEAKTEEFMRRFIIPPVLRKLDDDIPLEYLNESRMVCICFIHVDTQDVKGENVALRDLMTQVVNKAFVKIYVTVTKMQGALTKVIMFDKGLTYLVVFGLPGFITENQCAHALKFSDQIRRGLLGFRLVDEVSIGVTTGSCYCGVLGHPRRQEYTVIGRKVNKAARLMVYYPGRVTCDQDTAYHSKLPNSNFELQEHKELKGIANPGKIFEFVNAESSDDQTVASYPFPILGRDPELRYFKDVLIKANRECAEHVRISSMVNAPISSGLGLGKEGVIAKGTWMILFEGENGIGKSRMLSACIQEAERQNVRVYSVAMNLILSGQALFGLSSLVMEALGISDLRTIQEREDFLRKRVQDPELASELCMLNDVIHTKFPLNPKYQSLDVNASHVYGQHVLSTLLRVMYPDDLVMFVIDDAHLLDVLSWEYIVYLSRTPNIFSTCSIRRNAAGSPRIPDAVTRMIYNHKSIKVIRLNGLDTKHCLALACQLMQVKAIPQDVEKILVVKSQGVPAWCDQVLNELLRTGVLRLIPYSTSKKTPMITVEKKFLEKTDIFKKRMQNLWTQETNAREGESVLRMDSIVAVTGDDPSDVDPSKRMLVVKSDTNIAHVPISGTLQEILLDSFDELNSTEQIMLKCASVLGRKFSRQMLTRILPLFELNARKYESGFHHLMEARYLRCASWGSAKPREQAAGSNAPPECHCKTDASDAAFNDDMDEQTSKSAKLIRIKRSSMKSRPKYWNCKFLEFVKENLVEVVYDLMTEDQRKDFHLRSAKYLDSSVVRCESCGGGNTAYLFGIVLKSGELGVLDNEEALRAAANARRKSSAPKEEDQDKLLHYMGRRKTSLGTQLEGLKKTFQNNGTRVGQIELDILQSLRNFEIQKGKKCKCCGKSSKTDEAADRELEQELHSLRNSDDKNLVDLKPTGNEGNTSGNNGTDSSSSGDGSPTDRMSVNTIDLRLCECAALQAKICIEMVKHYRESQKFGKCMVNLLDAAESVITIGNGTQALIHLEDATGLMKAIRSGEFPPPDKDDQDDARIDDQEAEGQIEYLSGLSYFEIGVHTKAKDFFIKALARLGLVIHSEENRVTKEASIFKAKSKLWRSHNFRCCNKKTSESTTYQTSDEVWTKKIRILSYLHILLKQEKKMEMALLVTLWEVITAEEYGDLMQDVIPSYCNMMEMYSALSQHRDAERYEKLALEVIRSAFGSNEQIEPMGLLITANLFFTISTIRIARGCIDTASESGYLALRIAQTIHDNTLIVKVLPTLVQSLLMNLRITEVVEALQKLWYTSEEEDDWCGVAMYYAMCMDLLLNTAYPLENFSACENFVVNSDWTAETNMFRDYEIQYCMEASLALWYARYSRWENASKWEVAAESHKPRIASFLSVGAELKLLETQLIFVEHYLDCKRYQHFAKARNQAKLLMRTLTKSTKVVPVLKPRFLHLMAYYYRIRSRNLEADKQMRAAEKLAVQYGNQLEQEWIVHNRTVWSEMAIPTIKYFWLEHTENHTLDWHSSGKIPWANIMYSLPLPAWK